MKSIYKFIPFEVEHIIPNIKGAVSGTDRGLSSPLPRSGHRMVCIGSDLYIFGGYNHFIEPTEYNDEQWMQNCPLFKELWKFNTISRMWSRLMNQNNMPDELASHSAVACGPHMIVYGGTGTPFGEASSNSIHLCLLPKGEWKKLEATGNILPTPMYGQAVCRDGDNLYVVGGTTGYQYSIDVHALSLKSLTWDYLIPSLGSTMVYPDSRYRHEIVYHNKCLYVLGGGTSEIAFPLDALPTFNLESNGWGSTHTHPDRATGLFPRPRKCHVLVKYKQCVYIQGGTNETEHLSDLWKLDLTAMRWTLLKGTTEKPIYFHSAAVTDEGTLYIFGGIWEAESTRTDKIFKIHLDVPSLQSMAWQALDFYAPNLVKLPLSKLLEIGIPIRIAQSLKSVSEVG